jgi:hypothetical protein
MTAPITYLEVGGTAVDLADVDYNVTVSHGRSDVFQPSNPSNCQVTIRGPVAVNVTDYVRIAAYGTFRFQGEVTDARVEFLNTSPPTALTTFTAIGNLATLGTRLIEVDFPKETVRERIETILTEADVDYLNGATADLELYSVADDIPVPAMNLLDDLAAWSGGTFFDTMNGRIVFESYGVRGQSANPGTWNAQTLTWEGEERSWDSFPTSLAALELPADAVIFSPTWSKNITGIVNRVSITHGNTEHVDTVSDADSIAAYGLRSAELTTGLDTHDDAIARANAILLAQARPLWNLGQVSVLVDQLDTPTRDLLMVAQSGTTVLVPGLPAQGPLTSFLGITEGWTETYTPGQHTVTLSLSDPRYSYQTVTWENVPPALTWENVNPELAWYNTVTADDLQAA